jgi:hypothetical protein
MWLSPYRKWPQFDKAVGDQKVNDGTVNPMRDGECTSNAPSLGGDRPALTIGFPSIKQSRYG